MVCCQAIVVLDTHTHFRLTCHTKSRSKRQGLVFCLPAFCLVRSLLEEHQAAIRFCKIVKSTLKLLFFFSFPFAFVWSHCQRDSEIDVEATRGYYGCPCCYPGMNEHCHRRFPKTTTHANPQDQAFSGRIGTTTPETEGRGTRQYRCPENAIVVRRRGR